MTLRLGAWDGGDGFAGIRDLFAFENQDGRLHRWNCGQAAAATLIHFYGRLTDARDPLPAFLEFERRFPPDVAGGWLGTSRRRLEKALKAYGLRAAPIRGREALERSLREGVPALVMLGFPSHRLRGGIDLPGGHWMVAWGRDDDRLHLSNWGGLCWEDLPRYWKTWSTWWIDMSERALAVAPD